MHSAAMRVRHAMAFATNKFFNDRGFLYIHTPIITGADCEGAGEQFVVSALLPEGGGANGHGEAGGGPPLTPAGNVDYTKVNVSVFFVKAEGGRGSRTWGWGGCTLGGAKGTTPNDKHARLVKI